ncbi:MAG: complex I NDUFA9 subunit family protein [Chloroflexota bacterium]|nr:complex I NDUFA9 subunit family protein [Chloroflexota bacterium]MDE2942001.1 complex I NDUFA9 subunit family protein [Chloroflexota bacterium]MDE3267099.1 complex I NDUFA9 subunit family protein [Chloroflexota bacterium]
MILVTGATGFVGRNVVRALRTRGRDVRCLVRSPGRARRIVDYGVELAYGDVTDPPSVARAMDGVDAVVHLVAVIRERGRRTFDLVNRQATETVAYEARLAGVRHMVHVSAIGAQEDPAYPYLNSKWQGEQAVLRSGVVYTIIRPSLLFGEGDEFVNTLAGMVRAFPIVPVAGTGKTVLQPISVEEVGAIVAEVAGDPRFGGRTIEIGGPQRLTYDEIVDVVKRTLGVRRLKVHIPLSLMFAAVRVMEAVIPNPPATTNQLRMLALDNVTDEPPVESVFRIKPRTLEGNVGYIRTMSYLEALRVALGFMPGRIRGG